VREQSRHVGLDAELTATDARDGFARAEREHVVVRRSDGARLKAMLQRAFESAAYA